MSWFNVLGEENSANSGNLFESYVRVMFSQGPVEFSSNDARENVRQTSHGRREKKNYIPVNGVIKVGWDREIVRVPRLAEAVLKDEDMKKMFYSRNDSEPLIDMIYRVDDGFVAIQATIGKTHSCQVSKIRELKTALGVGKNCVLKIFYAVPSARYEHFVTTPVNPLNDQDDLNDVSIYHIGVSDISANDEKPRSDKESMIS
jgi:hypothetical protein